ncbi:MAG: nuclear transport factor 2 family protein [Solirubrobacterales bacterium]
MRAEDLEALRHGYEALSRGEVESVIALLDPEIEWQPGRDDPQSGVFTGRAGFEQFLRSWRESFDEFELEPEEETVTGDSVVVVVRQSGRGHSSGVALEVRTVHRWTIRNGIAVAWAAHRSRRDALTAILEPVVRDRIEVVYRGYDAFNRGDIEGSLTGLHPDIEWHTYIVPGPGGGVYHGHDGVRELWSDAERVFGGFKNVPERLFEAGDQVVAFVRVEGVGTQSGIPVQARIAHVLTLRDDRVIRVESFEDRDEALRVAGLPC